MRVWIALGILIMIVLAVNFAGAIVTNKNCPKDAYGSNNATHIKYFSSPLCAACWVQKPIIQKLADEQGDKFLLEEYNADFCRDAAAPHYIRGVPGFMIDGRIVYGLQTEEALKEMIG